MSEGKQVAKYIALGCGALTLLTCCLCGIFAAFGYSLLGGPHEYAHGFLLDVRNKDYGSALQRMDASYQGRHDPAAMERAIESLPPLAQHSEATLSNVSLDGAGHASVEGELTTPGGSVPIRLVLTQEQDYWYVQQVFVAGAQLP